MNETEIRAEIIKYLKTVPHCKFRVQQKHSKVRANHTEKGFSDIHGNLGPRAFYIEVKKPGGSLTLEQHKFINDRKNEGCLAFFATSVQEVREEFELAQKKYKKARELFNEAKALGHVAFFATCVEDVAKLIR
jgi:hypothetical protein